MTAILGILTSRFMGPIALAGVVVLAVLLAVSKLETKSARSQRDSAIRAEKVAVNNLTTCRGNTARLEHALDAQNRAVAVMRADGLAVERGAQEAAERARQEAAKAKASLAAFQRRPIRGATACERVEDVAAAIREDLG